MFSGISSILFLSNYFFSSKVLELYNSPQYLLFACPILLLWEYKIYRDTLNKMKSDLDISRMMMSAQSGIWTIGLIIVVLLVIKETSKR